MVRRLRSLAIVAAILGCVACRNSDCDIAPEPGQSITIGGLFSTTGSWNTLGKAGVAAAELAAEDVNAYFAQNGSSMRVGFTNIDTKLDPALARAGLQTYARRDVRIVVGPQSSAEVSALMQYADSVGIVVISPSSTAGALAVANDNILRMCPADVTEGKAMAAMIAAEGRTDVVTLWRDDIGNNGLRVSTAASLAQRGVHVVEGRSYSATEPSFDGVLADIRAIVAARIAAVGRDRVAVYNPGFDEVATMFAAIPEGDTVLRGVRWYGGDGTVMSDALLPQVAFCTQVSYPNPQFGIGDGAAIAGPIAERIKQRSGVEPDAYALSVYDAVWIAAKTYAVRKLEWNAQAYVKEFILQAGNTFGVTGPTMMNDAGDRSFGNYDMMGVRLVEGQARWVRIGAYTASTDTYRPD